MGQEGNDIYPVGDETIEATAGQIVVVPAGQPHTVVNVGHGPARHLLIHVTRRMIAGWLEDCATEGLTTCSVDLSRLARRVGGGVKPSLSGQAWLQLFLDRESVSPFPTP